MLVILSLHFSLSICTEEKNISRKHSSLLLSLLGSPQASLFKHYFEVNSSHSGIIPLILVHEKSFSMTTFVGTGSLYLFNGPEEAIDMINLLSFFYHLMWTRNKSVSTLSHYTHRIYLILPLDHATFILFCFMYYVPRPYKSDPFLKFKTCYLLFYWPSVSFCTVIKESILFNWRNTLWL